MIPNIKQKIINKIAFNKLFNKLISNKLDVYISACAEGLSYYYPGEYETLKMSSRICDYVVDIYPNLELIDVDFRADGIFVNADIPIIGEFVENIVEYRLSEELGDMVINAYLKQ